MYLWRRRYAVRWRKATQRNKQILVSVGSSRFSLLPPYLLPHRILKLSPHSRPPEVQLWGMRCEHRGLVTVQSWYRLVSASREWIAGYDVYKMYRQCLYCRIAVSLCIFRKAIFEDEWAHWQEGEAKTRRLNRPFRSTCKAHRTRGRAACFFTFPVLFLWPTVFILIRRLRGLFLRLRKNQLRLRSTLATAQGGGGGGFTPEITSRLEVLSAKINSILVVG